MRCHLCTSDRQSQPTVARCKLCSTGVCSDHLARALRSRVIERPAGCGHFYVACGWLARATARAAS